MIYKFNTNNKLYIVLKAMYNVSKNLTGDEGLIGGNHRNTHPRNSYKPSQDPSEAKKKGEPYRFIG